MRRFVLLACAGVALSFTAPGVARAVPSAGPRPSPLAYDQLPVHRGAAVPRDSKRPRHIGGREKVRGIFTTFPPRPGQRVLAVTASEKLLAGARRGEGDGGAVPGAACISEQLDTGGDGEGARWVPVFAGVSHFWPRGKQNPGGTVRAVRAERVVRAGDRTTLETTDAWIDPSTGGARRVSHGTLALKPVGHILGAAELFAGREEGAHGRVHFVLVRKEAVEQPVHALSGTSAHSAGCGHLHLSLAAERGAAETVTLMVPVALPTSKEDRSPQVVGGDEGRSVERVRSRRAVVHLSVSQVARDPMPVVGLSYGWLDREQLDTRLVRRN